MKYLVFLVLTIAFMSGCTSASIDMRQCKATCGKYGVKEIKTANGMDDVSSACICRE